MTTLREAATQALEALEFMADEWGFTQKANRPERWQAIDALRSVLEQPEQEPVAWRWRLRSPTDAPGFAQPWNVTTYYPREQANEIEPLYTHPPRRAWQGLSKDESLKMWGMRSDGPSNLEIISFARAIEAALKERNT